MTPPHGAGVRAGAIALIALFVVIAGVLLDARLNQTAVAPTIVIADDLSVKDDLPRYEYDEWRMTAGGPPHRIAGKRVTLPRGRAVIVRGWVLDTEIPIDDAAVLGVIDDRGYEHVVSGLPRPDVVAALGNAAAEHSGYEARIDTASLAAGLHRFRIAVISRSNGVMHRAAVALQLTVR